MIQNGQIYRHLLQLLSIQNLFSVVHFLHFFHTLPRWRMCQVLALWSLAVLMCFLRVALVRRNGHFSHQQKVLIKSENYEGLLFYFFAISHCTSIVYLHAGDGGGSKKVGCRRFNVLLRTVPRLPRPKLQSATSF